MDVWISPHPRAQKKTIQEAEETLSIRGILGYNISG